MAEEQKKSKLEIVKEASSFLRARCNRGTVICSHNKFMDGTREIHSGEHRCSDCGHRETTAFRSDEENPEPTADATDCPFCGRHAAR